MIRCSVQHPKSPRRITPTPPTTELIPQDSHTNYSHGVKNTVTFTSPGDGFSLECTADAQTPPDTSHSSTPSSNTHLPSIPPSPGDPTGSFGHVDHDTWSFLNVPNNSCHSNNRAQPSSALNPSQAKPEWSSEHFGDNPTHKLDHHFQVYFQNKNLPMGRASDELELTCLGLSKLNADFIGLAETNINWDHPASIPKLWSSLRPLFKHVKLNPARANLNVPSLYQPGGVISITTDHTTGQVTDVFADPLGRWSIMYFCTHINNIAMIMVYQLPKTSCIGPCNVFAQQTTLLGPKQDPRKNFCLDLSALLLQLHDKGIYIFLGGDFNEDLEKTSRFQDKFSEVNLVDCHRLQHEAPFPPSYHSGSSRIDYIFISSTLVPLVVCSGIVAPHWKITSDHHGLFINFDRLALFSQSIKMPTAILCRLCQPMPEQRSAYIQALNAYFDYHKIESCLNHFQVHPTGTSLKQLDRDLSKAMLSAKKKVKRKSTTPWTPKLSQLRLSHRYWQICLKELTLSKSFSRSLQDVCNKLRIPPPYINNVPELQKILSQSCKDLLMYREKAIEKWDTFLQQQAKMYASIKSPVANIVQCIKKQEAQLIAMQKI